MANIKENELPVAGSVSNSDYLRIVTSGGASERFSAAILDEANKKILNDNNTSGGVSVPSSGTVYYEIQSVTLTPGKYILQGIGVFPNATTNVLGVSINTTATQKRSSYDQRPGRNMVNDKIMVTCFADIQTTTTMKLYALQNSGSTMSVLGSLNYIRVGA